MSGRAVGGHKARAQTVTTDIRVSLAHAAAPEVGQHSRRATPSWMRTDLVLPLSVSGRATGAASGAGWRGQPPMGAGRRWQGRISSGVELCNQRVVMTTTTEWTGFDDSCRAHVGLIIYRIPTSYMYHYCTLEI